MLSLFTFALLHGSTVLAAESSPALLKAKKDADPRGYTFITNHDDIVNKAKQEGKLRVLADIRPTEITALVPAFGLAKTLDFARKNTAQDPMWLCDGIVEQELRGKQLSTVRWEHHQHRDQWQAKVFAAYDFPKTEIKR